MKLHQKELHFYPSDYEAIEVTRNHDRFDVSAVHHDGNWNDLEYPLALTDVTWETVQQVLFDDYGIEVE